MKYPTSINVSDSQNLELTVTRLCDNKFSDYVLTVWTYAGKVKVTDKSYDAAFYKLSAILRNMYE